MVAIRRQAGLGWGLLGAFAFLAQPASAEWVGLHRVDSLALALTLGGLVAAQRGRIVLAALLCGLSVLSKQTYLAAPLAISVWLLLDGRRRDTARFVVAFGLPLAVVGLALELATGGNFLRHVVGANLNPFSAALVLDWIGWATRLSGPLLVAGLVGVLVLPRSWWLWKLYFAFTVPNVLALGKDGASFNYWFEPLAAAGILGAGALAFVFARRPMMALAATGAVFLAVAPSAASTGAAARLSALRATADRPAVDWAVDAARRAPGDVLSEDLAITALAGKPLAFEYVIYSILWTEGLWREDQLVADLDQGRYSHLILLGDEDPLAGDCLCMPPPVWDALRRNYGRIDSSGRYVLYQFQPVAAAAGDYTAATKAREPFGEE